MNSNKENIASDKPYDESLFDNWTMYDKIEYVQNKDDCQEYNNKMFSGNVVKQYRCAIKEAYEIKHDNK